MLLDCKTIFSGKYVFKLTYKLTKENNEYFVTITSEKFMKNTFISQSTTPLAEETEECKEKLTNMNKYVALNFFKELKNNLVFPCSLSYILEDIS